MEWVLQRSTLRLAMTRRETERRVRYSPRFDPIRKTNGQQDDNDGFTDRHTERRCCKALSIKAKNMPLEKELAGFFGLAGTASFKARTALLDVSLTFSLLRLLPFVPWSIFGRFNGVASVVCDPGFPIV